MYVQKQCGCITTLISLILTNRSQKHILIYARMEIKTSKRKKERTKIRQEKITTIIICKSLSKSNSVKDIELICWLLFSVFGCYVVTAECKIEQAKPIYNYLKTISMSQSNNLYRVTTIEIGPLIIIIILMCNKTYF